MNGREIWTRCPMLFLSAAATAYFLIGVSEAKKVTIVPTGGECDLDLRAVSPVPPKGLSFWGRVISVSKSEEPLGEKIIFYPSKLSDGVNRQKFVTIQPKSSCTRAFQKDEFYRVHFNSKGFGSAFRIAVTSEGKPNKKKLNGKASRFPKFEPEFSFCDGFSLKKGFTLGDALILGKILSLKDEGKILLTEVDVIKSWKDPALSRVKVIQKKGHACSSEHMRPGDTYAFILFRADKEYFYFDCCDVMGPLNDEGAQKRILSTWKDPRSAEEK